MAGTISLTGLISDVNWTKLIEDLMNAKKAYVLTPYQNSKNTYQTKLSAWQDFNRKLSEITNYISTYRLDEDDGYAVLTHNLTASSSTIDPDSVIQVSLGNLAQKGTYEIKILALAQKEKIASDAHTSNTEALSLSGTIQINGVEISIDADDTLLDIASAINRAQAGVTATVLKVSDTEFRLVLESENEGTPGISLSDPDDILYSLGILDSFENKKNIIRAAQDASIEIDGFSIVSSSNTVKDVIPGVTLTLKALTGSDSLRLSIQNDDLAIQKKVNDLLTKVNTVLSFVNSQNTYLPGTTKPLSGEVNLNIVRNNIIAAVYTDVSENNTYKTLSSIGITFGKDGNLSLNASKFLEALSTSKDEVVTLLKNFGEALYEKMNLFVDPYTGTLKNVETSIKSQISRIDRRIRELEERFEREKEILEKKYSALELLISQSNLIKGWMENQIKAMFKKE